VSDGLQAIVFDFDGVIANSEPMHLRAFQQVLADDGITLTAAEYFERYLGYDDAGAFEALARDRGIAIGDRRIAELIARKAVMLQDMLRGGDVLFPGAADFVRDAAASVPIAVASGALRHEIDEILDASGLAALFTAIVASGDTPEGKPSPAPYLLAFNKLSEQAPHRLDPARCVAIEDSNWGLDSARGAGLRCVAVTNSYPANELNAELIVDGLQSLTLPMLERVIRAGRSADVRA
jgi:beta-phosphoglucomutase